MAYETVLSLASTQRDVFLVVALLIPLITLLASFAHGVYAGREAPWRHVYALIVHLYTAAVAAFTAFVVYHIARSGSPLGGSVPWAAFSAALVGWLLTLAVVKRAVDFFHLRSVRKPIVLFLSWLVAWALPFSLVHFDMWRVPGPFAATGGAAVVIAFIVLRFVLRLILSVRDRS